MLEDAKIKELVNTPARSCLIQRDHVYLPFLRVGKSKDSPGHKLIRLHRKQVSFLYFYGSDGLSFEEAAQKSGMSFEQASRFWRRPDVQAWLADMAAEVAVQTEWKQRPAKWWALGQKWLEAPKEKTPSKGQLEVWKEFGDRVVPKPSRGNEAGSGSKVEIHIDGAVIDYFKTRQKTIETSVEAEVRPS